MARASEGYVEVSGRAPSRRHFLRSVGSAGLAVALLFERRQVLAALAAEAASAGPTVRVLLRRGGGVDAETATIAAEGEATLRDLGADAKIADVGTSERVTVGRDGARLWVQVGDGRRRGSLDGPIVFRASDDRAMVKDLTDGPGATLTYRGSFEVRASPTEGRVCLVNVAPLEDYVAGVVPRELPESFGLQALRAQAIAARGFAMGRAADSTHKSLQADVCDGVDCQVYGGASAERELAREAVKSTRNLVLWRDGKIMTPMYSSTCGGHTESLARLSGSVKTLWPTPTLDAVADGPLPKKADLTTDDGASAFIRESWDSHCAAAPRYRWTLTWERGQIEEILTGGLRRLSGVDAVSPVFGAADSIGRFEGLAVVSRGVSGRAAVLSVRGSQGEWTVSRDWAIRSLLRGPNGDPLPSSAISLEPSGTDRNPSSVTAYGAGFGHGVGMCQWGARGLAAKGKSGEEILAHYYPASELKPLG